MRERNGRTRASVRAPGVAAKKSAVPETSDTKNGASADAQM
jgi:hypothetical protein